MSHEISIFLGTVTSIVVWIFLKLYNIYIDIKKKKYIEKQKEKDKTNFIQLKEQILKQISEYEGYVINVNVLEVKLKYLKTAKLSSVYTGRPYNCVLSLSQRMDTTISEKNFRDHHVINILTIPVEFFEFLLKLVYDKTVNNVTEKEYNLPYTFMCLDINRDNALQKHCLNYLNNNKEQFKNEKYIIKQINIIDENFYTKKEKVKYQLKYNWSDM